MLIGAALAYAARGWRIFPCNPRTKAPLIPRKEGGRGHLDATTDPGTILAWWKRFPDAAIGNRPAEDEVILDVDPRHGGDWSFQDLKSRLGDLPETVTTITGGGGRHFRFRIPHDFRLPKELATGVDLKGSNGFVIIPPSRHPSGNAYRWAAGRSPEEQEIAVLPEMWLQEIARLTSAKTRKVSTAPVGLREHENLRGQNRCVPPLPAREVQGIVAAQDDALGEDARLVPRARETGETPPSIYPRHPSKGRRTRTPPASGPRSSGPQ